MPEGCVHTEVRTSTEFCTQHAMDRGYSPKARTKWNLEESGLQLVQQTDQVATKRNTNFLHIPRL
jgi:hypothetical protein